MEPQIGQNATKTPSKMHLFFAPFLVSFFGQNEPQNGAQNGTGAPFFRDIFHMWSQTSPLAPLLSTFGRFGGLLGSILASFCPILASIRPPFFAPQVFDDPCLEHLLPISTTCRSNPRCAYTFLFVFHNSVVLRSTSREVQGKTPEAC